MAAVDKLIELIDYLIREGEALVATADSHGTIPDKETAKLCKWSNDLILFNHLAGDMVSPWAARLQHDHAITYDYSVTGPVSALKSIRDAITNGLLNRYADLVDADTFADLTEQAEHLLSQGYFLAAGVILRAVLEERLRKLCERHNVTIAKARPTISDLNQAIYSAKPPVYDKSMMHHVTSLASVGNDAAHNSPNLKREDVERLAHGVREFLAKFST